MADRKTVHLTQVGSVWLKVMASGVESTVMLTEVYLAPGLAKNIVSYGKLERKGFALVYNGKRRAIVWRSNDAVAFDVKMGSKVLYVDIAVKKNRRGACDTIMAAID